MAESARDQNMATGNRLSPEAFGEAFATSFPILFGIAAGVLANRSLVEDVLQESAVIALGKLGQFDADTSFTAWMGQIVRFVALNHGRRDQRTRRLRTALAENAPRESSPLSALHAKPPALDGHGELLPDGGAFDDRLTQALEQLDPTARCCILLRSVNNLPYRDIARSLDIPEGTAMSHVHRARRDLRNRLAETESPS